jgi:transglutaminase-like putative cysteine protease
MNRMQYPPVYAGLYVLLITAVSAAMTVLLSGAAVPAVILFCAVLYGVGLASGWRYNQNRYESLKKVTDGIAALALFLFFIALISTGFDKAFLLLLIGIQASRNFTLATRRDFYYSYVISLILILYAASLSKESLFIVTILVYVLAGMFTLMADHIDDTLARAQGGDREVLIRRMSLPVKGAGLAVAVTALSILIYLLVPRPTSPHVQAFPAGGGWTYNNKDWERQAKEDENQGSGRSNRTGTANGIPGPVKLQNESREQGTADYPGFQKKFDISKACSSLDDSVVFYLQADQPLYARVKSFDLFDGRSWMSSEERSRKILEDQGFKIDKQFSGTGISQTFSIEADLTSHIPCAYRPVKAWFPGGVIGQEDDLALRAPGFLRKGTVYSVLSDIGMVNNRFFSSGENTGDFQKYLQLSETLSPRVKDLGATVTQNLQGSLAKAEAIEQYLKTNYFYTLDTVLHKPDSDVLDKFLFEQKQGHCEYFASSMVVMLRTINVPARLATGYAAFRENAITGYYEVRKKNAHAWVEAYIEGFGWMTFEPTSSFQLPRRSKRIVAASGILTYLEDRLSSMAESNRGTWWAELIRKIMEFFKRIWRVFQELFAALVQMVGNVFSWFAQIGWILFLVMFSAVAIAYPVLKLAVRFGERVDLAQLRKKDARQFIIQCYREMEKMLAEKKLPRRPFCAPSEYTPLVAVRLPHLVPSVEVITGLFNRARYSDRPIGAREADSAFEAYQFILEFINNKPEERDGVRISRKT